MGEGKDADDYFPNAASNTTEYFCGTNDEALEEPHLSWDGTDVAATNDHTLIDHEEISRAEAGKYIIHYHVSDSAGNPECEGGSPSRTVIVRDTLPPVITLHLKGDLIHTSAADQTGLGGESMRPLTPRSTTVTTTPLRPAFRDRPASRTPV